MSKAPKTHHWPCRYDPQDIGAEERKALTLAYLACAATALQGDIRQIDGLLVAFYEIDDMILASTVLPETPPQTFAVKIKVRDETVLEMEGGPHQVWVHTFVSGPWQKRLLALDIVDPATHATEVKGGNSHE